MNDAVRLVRASTPDPSSWIVKEAVRDDTESAADPASEANMSPSK
jgi:hypothetical protein